MSSQPPAGILGARHIQDHASAANVEPHWGYADRVVPCTNDAGSCAYLDLVYGAHDRGLVYVGILWLTFVAVFLAWGILRATPSKTGQSGLARLGRAISATSRRVFMPESARYIFGRTSRYQIAILALLTAYLTIWSFVGMTYEKWITPVKNMPGVYNTRTSLGPWSDRVGVLAYALTPLSVLLATRESLLSVITGLPYQSFNFLHRWIGYIIIVQSTLHTIGWCIIEIKLYQPQPTVAKEWIAQLYMIWGVVAFILLLLLYVFTLPTVIRLTGYEFFRKSHYVLAMVFIGACIAHWEKLMCFMIPSLIFWGIDRFVRLVRTFVLHRKSTAGNNSKSVLFHKPADAVVTHFKDSDFGDVVRLDFKHPHKAWAVGQHFYLCFPESSIWQSHPFTPLNLPETVDGLTNHAYIFRAKSGETKKVAEIAARKTAAATTPVILTGPYGEQLFTNKVPAGNILCVAGGTGITYVLPVLLGLLREHRSAASSDKDRKVDLVWVVRHRKDIAWVKPELDALVSLGDRISVRIYATRDAAKGDYSQDSLVAMPTLKSPSQANAYSEKPTEANVAPVDDGNGAEISSTKSASSSPASSQNDLFPAGGPIRVIGGNGGVAASSGQKHPNVQTVVDEFVQETVAGPTTVYASGPGPMMTDLRVAVAACNSGSKVWRGQERFDVALRCDDRLER